VVGGTSWITVKGSSPARPSYTAVAAEAFPGPRGPGLLVRSPGLGEVWIERSDAGDLLVKIPGIAKVERGNIRAGAPPPADLPHLRDTRREGLRVSPL